jgi:hypothetical protein
MTNFKAINNDIYKTYSKKLKVSHEANLINFSNYMEYLVTYLKFMRDYYILTEPLVLESGEENLKIASIATAISEYEKYKNCINTYYFENGARKVEGTSEEVQNKYNIEKKFHWNNFWNLLNLNMEDWTTNA